MEEPVIDPNYEFEAPQFVDFNIVRLAREDNADIDSWFDHRPGDEGGIEIPLDVEERENVQNSEATSVAKKQETAPPNLTESKEQGEVGSAAVSSEETNEFDPDSLDEAESENLNNVDASVQENKNEVESEAIVTDTQQANSANDQHIETNKSSSIENRDENKSSAIERGASDAESQNEAESQIDEECLTQNDAKASSSESNNTTDETQSGSDQPCKPKKRARRSSSTVRTSVSTVKDVKRLRKPSMIKLKTTEEMEMECIAKLRQQTKRHIRANERLMKKAMSCPKANTVRAANTTLTRPQEFHFQTDKRVKQHPMTTRADHQEPDVNGDDAEKGFWNSLRQHPPSPSWKHRTATIPKPFNLSDGGQRKRKFDAFEKDQCESFALQVHKFLTTTPPRFRTRRSNDSGFKSDADNVHEKPAGPKPVTLPKTPNLNTKTRSRPVPQDVLTKEQREAKELEEMKNFKFKAKPFCRHLVETDGTYGIPKVEKMPATVPKPFVFNSDVRLETRKEKETLENQDELTSFTALPQPSFEKVFRPLLPHKRTEPKAFSFDEKDKERWQKKEEKIQQIYKEEKEDSVILHKECRETSRNGKKGKAEEFKAQPLPFGSPDTLPAVPTKCPTNIKPFDLNTEHRGAKKVEQLKEKVNTEKAHYKATFKAKPCTVVHEVPFVPQKSSKPLTEVSEFRLNTDYRAERREELEISKKEREEIDNELRREREAQRAREEEQALVLLRKQMVHKAQPIHKYKNVRIKPSTKLLTEAQSPAWSDNKRRRLENP